jgi:hypothetical protein
MMILPGILSKLQKANEDESVQRKFSGKNVGYPVWSLTFLFCGFYDVLERYD